MSAESVVDLNESSYAGSLYSFGAKSRNKKTIKKKEKRKIRILLKMRNQSGFQILNEELVPTFDDYGAY